MIDALFHANVPFKLDFSTLKRKKLLGQISGIEKLPLGVSRLSVIGLFCTVPSRVAPLVFSHMFLSDSDMYENKWSDSIKYTTFHLGNIIYLILFFGPHLSNAHVNPEGLVTCLKLSI